MSLLVWIPMVHGDCKDQGLLGVETSVINTVTYVDGKLGKAAQIGNGSQVTNGIQINTNLVEELGTQYSCSVWIKPLGNHVHYEGAIISSGDWNNKCWAFGVNQNNTAVDVFCGGYNRNVTCSVPVNEWTHLVSVNDGTHTHLYKNGELISTVTTSSWPLSSDTTITTVGRESYAGGYFSFNGCIQDLRIYDHALSPREIKEISKGLVLHYPLNRGGLGPSNLIKNGFGELGSENWTSSTSISTTDIPSGQSDIKASFSGGYTIEHINIYPTHNYKFSTWIKATATSGNAYPSLYPYDVDEKFIDYFKCPAGFNLNTMTTLKQELKSGDTKIYVNDLSQWNANSGHYYNWAAIFGYKDSTGRTYPDGTYTQNCVRFGNGTNGKTNLDKTNNIITLTSAYTGPTMPIGTKLCSSTEGSTYYYPLGGINLSTIQDWTYKEVVFSGNDARLRYAKTVTFWTYNNNRMAGIKMVDLTYEDMDSTIEYDCSGYCNNGTSIGTLTYSGDTPRYNVSTHFTGTNYISLPSPSNEIKTISLWAKWDVIPSGQSVIFVDYKSKLGLGLMSTGILCGTSGVGNFYTYSKSSIVANKWYHFVIVNNGEVTGTARKLYIDGVEQTPTSNTSNWTYGVQELQIGKRSTTSDGFVGCLSDFRAYNTVLSADDVLELYHTPITLSNNGTLLTQGEYVEV